MTVRSCFFEPTEKGIRGSVYKTEKPEGDFVAVASYFFMEKENKGKSFFERMEIKKVLSREGQDTL